MTRDDHHTAQRQLSSAVNYMAQQCVSTQSVQHFGPYTFHARTLTRSHDDHINRTGRRI